MSKNLKLITSQIIILIILQFTKAQQNQNFYDSPTTGNFFYVDLILNEIVGDFHALVNLGSQKQIMKIFFSTN